MNNVTPAVPEHLAAELVRRGLPVEFAQRAASNSHDHRRDLVSELLRRRCRGAIRRQKQCADSATHARWSRKLSASISVASGAAAGRSHVSACADSLAVHASGWRACWYWRSDAVAISWVGLDAPATAKTSFRSDGCVCALKPCWCAFFRAAAMLGSACFGRRAAMGWQWVLLSACTLGFSVCLVK